MKWDKNLRRILAVQTFVLFLIASGIAVISPEQMQKYELYELFGATVASILTLFGLLRMKQLTEE